MRRLAVFAVLALLPALPAAAQDSSLRIESNNVLNITEVEQAQSRNTLSLRQTGVRNIARVRQRGATNQIEMHQTGANNSAGIWQSATGNNTLTFNQYDTVSAATAGQDTRMNRALIIQGGETSYLTAYQNGPVNILQITQNPQPYGRLGRR